MCCNYGNALINLDKGQKIIFGSFILTKDQNEERVERHHPKNMFLQNKTAHEYKRNVNENWKMTGRKKFTKNTRDPSRPSIWNEQRPFNVRTFEA